MRNKYIEQIENLKKQGWEIWLSLGGISHLHKKNISGIVVDVDQSTGVGRIHFACPIDYAEKHQPSLLEIKRR